MKGRDGSGERHLSSVPGWSLGYTRASQGQDAPLPSHPHAHSASPACEIFVRDSSPIHITLLAEESYRDGLQT